MGSNSVVTGALPLDILCSGSSSGRGGRGSGSGSGSSGSGSGSSGGGSSGGKGGTTSTCNPPVARRVGKRRLTARWAATPDVYSPDSLLAWQLQAEEVVGPDPWGGAGAEAGGLA